MNWIKNLASLAAVATIAGCACPTYKEGRLNFPTPSANAARKVTELVQNNPDLAKESYPTQELKDKKNLRWNDWMEIDAEYARFVRVNEKTIELNLHYNPRIGSELRIFIHPSKNERGILFCDYELDGIKCRSDIPALGTSRELLSNWRQTSKSFDAVVETKEDLNVSLGAIFYSLGNGNLQGKPWKQVHTYDSLYRQTLNDVLKSGALTNQGAGIRFQGRQKQPQKDSRGYDMVSPAYQETGKQWNTERDRLLKALK